MPITAYILDGAGTKGRTSNVVNAVTERLRWKLDCRVEWLDWEASLMGVGGTTPWPLATHHAVINLAARIRESDDDIILVGFSAGCRPVREFLEQHPELRARVVAVAMLADPWQPRGRQQHGITDGPGWGIMGERLTPIGKRTFYCGHPADPIPRAAGDSLLRYITPSSDVTPGQFVREFVRHAHRGRLQLIPFLGLPLHLWFGGLSARIGRSVAEAQSYLGDGHTSIYVREYITIDPNTKQEDHRSLAHRLADSVAWSIQHPKLA